MRTSSRKSHKNSSATKIFTVVLLIAVSGAGYVYCALERQLPRIQPVASSTPLQASSGSSKLTWPANGQAAVAIPGTNILETNNNQTPAPIASTAKIITALTVLQKKPLNGDEQGPTITLSDADVALYSSYVAQEGSVVSVSAGEQISERQVLEAMMLPSANNMADSLASWAFGSLSDYATAANQYVTQLGLKGTHVGTDASGFSPTTTSTAHDLAIIGEQAMQNPALAQIVAEKTTSDVPGVTALHNVNEVLGLDNIVGIKTGNTDQAGGVFLSASKIQVNNQPTTIVTALVGSPTLFQAMNDSLPLITSAQANFDTTSLLAAQAVIGEYRQPWGGVLSAATETDLTSEDWRGSIGTATVKLEPISYLTKVGDIIGTVTSAKTPFDTSHHTNVILQQAPSKATIWWRLLHP
jgi:D-alanyl-D-alanine carboxypeptidase (penicillin-binding protein 5/6)